MALPMDDLSWCWCCEKTGRPGREDRHGWICDQCWALQVAPKPGDHTLCSECGRAIYLGLYGAWQHIVMPRSSWHPGTPKPFFTDREVTREQQA